MMNMDENYAEWLEYYDTCILGISCDEEKEKEEESNEKV